VAGSAIYLSGAVNVLIEDAVIAEGRFGIALENGSSAAVQRSLIENTLTAA